MMNIATTRRHLSINAGSRRWNPSGRRDWPFQAGRRQRQEIALEWDGKIIRKTVDEILDRSTRQVVADANTPAPARLPPGGSGHQDTLGPAKIPAGYKVCNPNDKHARRSRRRRLPKVSIATPFGNACRWDPVGR